MAGNPRTVPLLTPRSAVTLMALAALALPAPVDADPIGPDEARIEPAALRSLGPLSLGEPARAVRTRLGRPERKARPVFAAADGAWHATWHYPSKGITLGMVSESRKGPATVASITLTRPCDWKTSRGIAVGSTRAEAEAAYPPATRDPDFSDDTRFVVGSVYQGLSIAFQDDVVVRLSLGSFAE